MGHEIVVINIRPDEKAKGILKAELAKRGKDEVKRLCKKGWYRFGAHSYL
jgi:hypothetical protein